MCFLGFLAILAIDYLAPKSSFVVFPFDVLVGLLIHFSRALWVQTSTTKEQLLGIRWLSESFPFLKSCTNIVLQKKLENWTFLSPKHNEKARLIQFFFTTSSICAWRLYKSILIVDREILENLLFLAFLCRLAFQWGAASCSVVGNDVPGCHRMSHGCVVRRRGMREGWIETVAVKV